MKMGTSNFDIQAIIAVAWLLASVTLTLLLGNQVGGRGWLWICINNLLCFIGCAHEFYRYRQREQARRNNA
jgi:hypothetical protein